MGVMYYLMDLERTIGRGIPHYWVANRHGYTTEIKDAGLFDGPVAKRLVENDFDKRTIMIEQKVVETILK